MSQGPEPLGNTELKGEGKKSLNNSLYSRPWFLCFYSFWIKRGSTSFLERPSVQTVVVSTDSYCRLERTPHCTRSVSERRGIKRVVGRTRHGTDRTERLLIRGSLHFREGPSSSRTFIWV